MQNQLARKLWTKSAIFILIFGNILNVIYSESGVQYGKSRRLREMKRWQPESSYAGAKSGNSRAESYSSGDGQAFAQYDRYHQDGEELYDQGQAYDRNYRQTPQYRNENSRLHEKNYAFAQSNGDGAAQSSTDGRGETFANSYGNARARALSPGSTSAVKTKNLGHAAAYGNIRGQTLAQSSGDGTAKSYSLDKVPNKSSVSSNGRGQGESYTGGDGSSVAYTNGDAKASAESAKRLRQSRKQPRQPMKHREPINPLELRLMPTASRHFTKQSDYNNDHASANYADAQAHSTPYGSESHAQAYSGYQDYENQYAKQESQLEENVNPDLFKEISQRSANEQPQNGSQEAVQETYEQQESANDGFTPPNFNMQLIHNHHLYVHDPDDDDYEDEEDRFIVDSRGYRRPNYADNYDYDDDDDDDDDDEEELDPAFVNSFIVPMSINGQAPYPHVSAPANELIPQNQVPAAQLPVSSNEVQSQSPLRQNVASTIATSDDSSFSMAQASSHQQQQPRRPNRQSQPLYQSNYAHAQGQGQGQVYSQSSAAATSDYLHPQSGPRQPSMINDNQKRINNGWNKQQQQRPSSGSSAIAIANSGNGLDQSIGHAAVQQGQTSSLAMINRNQIPDAYRRGHRLKRSTDEPESNSYSNNGNLSAILARVRRCGGGDDGDANRARRGRTGRRRKSHKVTKKNVKANGQKKKKKNKTKIIKKTIITKTIDSNGQVKTTSSEPEKKIVKKEEPNAQSKATTSTTTETTKGQKSVEPTNVVEKVVVNSTPAKEVQKSDSTKTITHTVTKS